MSVLNAVAATVGILNSVVVAYHFGTSRTLEVYFAAVALLSMVISLTQAGQLNEVILPLYHEVKYKIGIHAARRDFSVVVNWMLLILVVVSIGLWFAAPFILGLLVPGFASSDIAFGARLFRWVIPLIGLTVYTSMLHLLANAERRFGRPEALTVVSRILTTLAIALLASPIGIWAMVVSLWLGRLIKLFGYIHILHKIGYRHAFQLRTEEFDLKQIAREMTGPVSYVGATQFYALILNASLSLMPQGVFAVYNYARRVYDTTNGVILRPISIVFFTDMSEAVARLSDRLKGLSRKALARCLAICSIVVTCVVVAGRPALHALWGERFGQDNLDLATQLLLLFFVTAFFNAHGGIMRRVNASLGFVRRQYFIAGAVRPITAALIWVLSSAFDVRGLMVGLFLAMIMNNLVYTIPLVKWRRDLVVFYERDLVLRWLGAILAGVAAATVLHQFLPEPSGENRFAMAGLAILLSSTAATAALATAWALRVKEVVETIGKLQLYVSGLASRV